MHLQWTPQQEQPTPIRRAPGPHARQTVVLGGFAFDAARTTLERMPWERNRNPPDWSQTDSQRAQNRTKQVVADYSLGVVWVIATSA